MESENFLDNINYFREKAEQGKLVVFVGAGVSCNVKGMPSWYQLIKKMAEYIDYTKCTNCRFKVNNCSKDCLLKDDFSTDEFLKIPQYVFNEDKDKYDQIINESIHNVDVDAPMSSAIFDINPVHIITTNYDTLLESSTNDFRKQYEVIVHDSDLLNSKKGKYIIKMHGDLNDSKTIVLKEQDYLVSCYNKVVTPLSKVI